MVNKVGVLVEVISLRGNPRSALKGREKGKNVLSEKQPSKLPEVQRREWVVRKLITSAGY